MTYFKATVVKVGAEAADMVAGGVLILFADPAPEALADISVLHQPSMDVSGPIAVGDTIQVGDGTLTVTAVGDIAADNLRSLGHVVIYANHTDQNLLPGAVHAEGTLTLPEPGQEIEFRSAG